MNIFITTQIVDKDDAGLGFFHSWIEVFAKHCEQVTVVCLKKGTYSFPPNVRVLSLGKDEGLPKWRWLLRFYQYVWQYQKEYDITFTHMNPEYVVLAGIPWRLMGKRVGLWYTHGSVPWTLRIAEKFAHVVFTGSPKSFRLASRKKNVMGQGITTELFKPESRLGRNTTTIISFGRMSAAKGHDQVVRSLSALSEDFPTLQLRIVGGTITDEDSTYEASLRKLVDDLSIQDRVTFVGGVPHEKVAEELQRADVYVSASTTGSADKTVYESMAMKLPVITSNESFVDTFPLEYRNMVISSNEPNDIIPALRSILELIPEEREKMGDELRKEILEKYDINSLVRRILELY